MTDAEIDVKADQIASVSLLTVNVGLLLIILDKTPTAGALWVAQFLLALSLPALAASSFLALAWGHKARNFYTFRVIGKVGQLLGVAVLATGFFHLSWLAGLVFLAAAITAFFCLARDLLNVIE